MPSGEKLIFPDITVTPVARRFFSGLVSADSFTVKGKRRSTQDFLEVVTVSKDRVVRAVTARTLGERGAELDDDPKKPLAVRLGLTRYQFLKRPHDMANFRTAEGYNQYLTGLLAASGDTITNPSREYLGEVNAGYARFHGGDLLANVRKSGETWFLKVPDRQQVLQNCQTPALLEEFPILKTLLHLEKVNHTDLQARLEDFVPKTPEEPEGVSGPDMLQSNPESGDYFSEAAKLKRFLAFLNE